MRDVLDSVRWALPLLICGCLPDIQRVSQDASTASETGIDAGTMPLDRLDIETSDTLVVMLDQPVVPLDQPTPSDLLKDDAVSLDASADAPGVDGGAAADAGATAVQPLTLSAGDAHTCALAINGHLFCWGSNHFTEPQPGVMDFVRPSPSHIVFVDRAVEVDCGPLLTCARSPTHSVTCWGNALFGEMNPMTGNWSRRTLEGPESPIALRAGAGHVCVLEAAGTVRCVGLNAHGQLGDGTVERRTTPQRLPDLSAIAELSLGREHSCARNRVGALWCWGANAQGQLGLGDALDRYRPVALTAPSGVVQIAAGGSHTCARTGSGSVWCWGDNAAGQLGDGTDTARATPQRVPGLEDAVDLVAGGRHTCAIRMRGGVVCWGDNDQGQLGDGTTTARTTPTPVPGLADVRALAAGARHTCARALDQSVRCWGANDQGQLGDGTTNSRNAPGLVVGFP